MLEFQSKCNQTINSITSIATVDTAATIFFAKDFRKVCPPQAPGVEGGYSEAELDEIQQLVDGQCEEIMELTTSWQDIIQQLKEQQEQSLKSHAEFVSKYEKVAQDLAMSEGLGQKYGAPRRRAQERIRTEVARDEQNAGKVDELLAQLEFLCAEVRRKEESVHEGNSETKSTEGMVDDGRPDFEQVLQAWSLLCQLRIAFNYRTQYLKIMPKPLDVNVIPFVDPERIPAPKVEADELGLSTSASAQARSSPQYCPIPPPSSSLQEVFEDVDKVCRAETKQLYESEGMGNLLGPKGVPDSLETWLGEAKDKILGRNGYREKAWKRLWAQVDRFEIFTNRKSGKVNAEGIPEEDEEPEHDDDEEGNQQKDRLGSVKLGVSGVCLRNLVGSMITNVSLDCSIREDQFTREVRQLEAGRDKNERLLRPRLGSPDAVDELNALDAAEKNRSKELTEQVLAFRAMLVKSLSDRAKQVVEDVTTCSNGLISLLDTTCRQELLDLPPDTAVPKKRMTLKRLRKAQRLRAEVAAGGQDRSHERQWPSVDLNPLKTALKGAEDLIPNLEQLLGPPPSAAPVAAAPPAKGAAKGKKPDPKDTPPPVVEKPSLVPDTWVQRLATESAVRGQVSTAHRVLISERDAVTKRFVKHLQQALDELRRKYDLILSQEKSWSERWDRQVQMLRQGNL